MSVGSLLLRKTRVCAWKAELAVIHITDATPEAACCVLQPCASAPVVSRDPETGKSKTERTESLVVLKTHQPHLAEDALR